MDDIKKLLAEQSAYRLDQKERVMKAAEPHIDSNGIAFNMNVLENVETRIIETLFSKMRGSEFIPFNMSGDPLDDFVSYHQETLTGKMEDIHHYTDDRKSVDVSLEKVTHQIFEGGSSYQYSTRDEAKAGRLNYNLVARKAAAAAEIAARFHDDAILAGRPNLNTTGISNNANVPVVSPITGGWTSSTTAAQLKADLSKLLDSIPTASKDNYRPTNLALGLDAYNFIKAAYFGSDTNNTVLKRILDEYPGLTVSYWQKLNTAGASSKSRAIAYSKDPVFLDYYTPVVYDESAPFFNGRYYNVDATVRSAGVRFLHPLSAAYMDLT